MTAYNTEFWNDEAREALVGRTITDTRYLTPDEASDQMGWHERGLILILDNGKEVLVSKDDEGNGPGSLFVGGKTLPTLPMGMA